jgi:hypothetical protein
VVQRILREHLGEFLLRTGGGLPSYVEKELVATARCGLFEGGVAVFVCDGCRRKLFLPFSCKRRGVCSSCGGRRMADLGEHLVGAVLPDVQVRQWVLSLPLRVRWHLVKTRGLLPKVRSVFVRQVFRWLRRAAARLGHPRGQPGGVVVQQRFGDGRFNIHFHALVLDGVYVDTEDGGTRFVPLPAPTQEDLGMLALRIARKVRRLAGLDEDADGDAEEADSLFTQLQGASLLGRAAIGPRAGFSLVRIGGEPVALAPMGALCAEAGGGFNLHAGVSVIQGRRQRLLALCRYLLRPAFAKERLSLRADGHVVLRLKKRWRDGTRALVFSPLEFIGLLASQIPPPREHLLTYHGILAPHACRRSRVVPQTPARAEDVPKKRPSPRNDTEEDAHRRRRRLLWAELLKRSYAIDALACECGGMMRLLCFIHDPEALKAIARSLGRTPGLPAQAARAPPLPAQGETLPRRSVRDENPI